MEAKGIERFYNSYKRNLYEIRHIEKTIFEESYDYQKWEISLREKSKVLREIYEQNESILNTELRAVLNDGELDEQLITDLLQHIMYFVYEDHYDFEVTEKVLNKLESYIETKAQDWQKIKYYYIKGLMIAKGMSLDLSYDWYGKITKVCGDWTKEDRNSSKERLLDAYLYRVMCLGAYEKGNCELFFESLNTAIKEWQRPETLEVLEVIYGPDSDVSNYVKKRLELLHFCMALIVTKENISAMSEARIKELYQYLEKEYTQGIKDKKLNCNIFLAYHKLRYFTEEITEEEYAVALAIFYKPSVYEYPTDMNFEMKQKDLFSCLEHNRYFCNSFTYALKLLPERIKYETDEAQREKIYEEIEEYICGLSTMENGVYLDVLLVETMQIMAKTMENQKVFQLLETIMLHRQLPTAIHLAMVSKLVTLYITYVLEKEPKLMIGVLGTTTVEEVQNKKEDIIEFALKSGLCHDVGKLLSTDVINLQSRKITDEEFGIIKKHPMAGRNIAEEIEAFKPYANIILGHHLFADKSGGYPADVNVPTGGYGVITDLITICDSIDAATDVLGRNYAKGKNFKKIAEELKAQSGTRYSKELVDVLCASKELSEEMEKLTGPLRAGVYHDLYVRRVKPLAYEKEYVERCFNEYEEFDKVNVEKFLMRYTDEVPQDIADNYKNFTEKYVMKTIKDEILGVFLGEKVSINNTEGVMIELILVKNSARKAGLGQKMLVNAEKELFKKGYAFVAMESKEELGIMERFMWINGYVAKDNNLLVKELKEQE